MSSYSHPIRARQLTLTIVGLLTAIFVAFTAQAGEKEDQIAIGKDLVSRVSFKNEQGVNGEQCSFFRDYARKNFTEEAAIPDVIQNVLVNCRIGEAKAPSDLDALLLFGLRSRSCRKNIPRLDPVAALLSESELFAICFYSNLGSSEINGPLRASDGRESKLPNITLVLDRALSKLPNYNGAAVTRLVKLSADQIQQYFVGQQIRWYPYTSASFGPNPFKGNVRFVITPKSAKDVHLLSGLPSETEVIFPRSSAFEVTGKAKLENGLVEISMKQI